MSQVARPAVNALAHAKHIGLFGVPSTVTAGDIRRLITRSGVQGVSNIAIQYTHRYHRTGNVYLTLSLPNFLRDNLRALEDATISGITLKAEASVSLPDKDYRYGDGIGTSVVVQGPPGKADVHLLREMLRGYTLYPGPEPITQISLPKGGFSRVSRFLVHFATASDAHRFVRDIQGVITDNSRDSMVQRAPYRANVVY
ncbi:uncharacterized protein BT62DRAFT_925191 [Guyanagaster necrorhizus]|uniref:RRM domain-containing protein n=1 Tax=Guyanagaster necrorhizus TaxID=856835 RepID=A0A9P7W5Q5_9AGAR|nr:uncharacterized protein BT62DRAFT_925191 [Guyanagaster necrorhizus MCA 3950]KAG7452637.1 hypothetical protein BT62DRAFT_925191 [Guyanagaster necrorhizus MCA 3950]